MIDKAIRVQSVDISPMQSVNSFATKLGKESLGGSDVKYTLGLMEKAGLDPDSKTPTKDMIRKFFPATPIDEPDAYTVNFIDLMKSIRSDKDGNQYQVPKYKNVPKKKVPHLKGPNIQDMLEMYLDNKALGGTDDYEQFKYDLYNRNDENLKISLDDYLEFKGMFSIKDAYEAQENADYKDLDMKGMFLKYIKDRTGFGLSALFEEEMEDRRKGY